MTNAKSSQIKADPKKSKKRRIVVLAVLAVLLAAAIGWIVWGNTALTISKFTVASPKLPAAFSGFRIVQVSDLHNAAFGESNEKLLAMIEEAEPDILVITGDLVDSRRTDLETAIAFAEQAAAIVPVYYVSGNHEARIPDYDKLKQGLESTGIVILKNERIELERSGERIALCGLDDPSFRPDYPGGDAENTVERSLAGFMSEDEVYTVLLAHRPEFFKLYAGYGADLVFSGHAHGGQIRLPFLGGIVAPGQGLFPKYDAGLYTHGTANMVVSRGLGNSLFPFRLNNRPEVVTVELIAK